MDVKLKPKITVESSTRFLSWPANLGLSGGYGEVSDLLSLCAALPVPEHDHEEFLTQAEIEALPGFGSGTALALASFTYVGNGTYPRTLIFPGGFLARGLLAAPETGNEMLCFSSLLVGGYLYRGSLATAVTWNFSSTISGELVIPSGNSIFNASGVLYNAFVWGVEP